MQSSVILNTTKAIDLTNISAQTKLNEGYFFGTVNCSIYLLCSLFSIIMTLPLIINWIFNCKKDNYADFLIISTFVSDFIDGFLVCPINLIKELVKMTLINSNVISKNFVFVTDSIDFSSWSISPLSLFLLSLHRFKQLVSPFKEGVKLNSLRIVILVSIWVFFPLIWFPIIWYKNLLITEELIYFLSYIIQCIIIILVFILNILISFQFKIKLKNTRLNKNDFRNEKKAILCTLTLASMLLITLGPFLILQPFKIYKYEFIEYFHDIYDIYYSFSYFYIIIDPLIVLCFNKNLRIKFRLISTRLKMTR